MCFATEFESVGLFYPQQSPLAAGSRVAARRWWASAEPRGESHLREKQAGQELVLFSQQEDIREHTPN